MKRPYFIHILFSLILFFLFVQETFAQNLSLRIISLAPATTEILFALGLDQEIIGVTSFCNFPPQAGQKEKVGTFSRPVVEKILALKPDIIFATGLEQAPVVKQLRKMGFKVCVSDPQNMEELLASIKEIGGLTGKDKEADELVGGMKQKITRIQQMVKALPLDSRPHVFVEIWYDPLMTAGKGSFIDELIQLAGGVNIAFDTPRPYSYFSPEQVIQRDPDWIILGYMVQTEDDEKWSRLGWDQLKAVKKNQIIKDINPDMLLRPGPRLVDALERIHERLFPR